MMNGVQVWAVFLGPWQQMSQDEIQGGMQGGWKGGN
jgi:hypothetical protein